MTKKKKKEPKENVKVVCRNKRARFDYSIESRFEAGMVLTGTEVKSLRLGKANLTDAYARIKDGEVWLYKAHISPYPWAHYDNHEPERTRKLLLSKKEIKKDRIRRGRADADQDFAYDLGFIRGGGT